MNGRMYDYNNGRFLSVDPFIASKSNTQALNPYSYIGNNPLSGTDPTGYNPWLGLRLLPAIGTALGEGAGAVASFFIRRAIQKRVAEQVALRAAQAASAAVAGAIVAEKTMQSDSQKPNPGFKPADPGETVLSQPIADPQSNTESLPIADPSPTNMEGPALDNGDQNSNQGIMTNEEKGNSSIGDQSNKPPFELDTNGTPDSIRTDLDAAGYPGKPTTETQENGTLHEGVV